MQEEKEQGPLSAEALARDEWRDDATELKPGDAPGHTLPESESGGGDEEEGGQSGPRPFSGTMLPPD
nr:hypothetical protein [uncultured Sphingosinicella sp.]